MSRHADRSRSSAARIIKSTPRVREHRERQKRHAMLVTIEVPPGLPDALVEEELLDEWDTENPKEIRKAIELVLTRLLE